MDANIKLQTTTMKTLRNALMNTIMDIRNGDIDAQDGIAVAKMGNVIVESYKTEIEAVRTADNLKERNIGYANALPIIEVAEDDVL